MTKGMLKGAQPTTCVICDAVFTPTRRNQEACPASTGRTCATAFANQKRRGGVRDANGKFTTPAPRTCERCGRTYQPAREDARTCGTNCPGKPDYELICDNKDCGKTFTVKGNSQGKGNQRYCSRKCREHVSRIRSGQRFRRYDGLTREQFEAEGEAQGWKCLICDRVPEPDGRRRMTDELPYLVADHDHETGQRRGLICGPCNMAIGMLGDDPSRCRAAADYLDNWNRRLTRERG